MCSKGLERFCTTRFDVLMATMMNMDWPGDAGGEVCDCSYGKMCAYNNGNAVPQFQAAGECYKMSAIFWCKPGNKEGFAEIMGPPLIRGHDITNCISLEAKRLIERSHRFFLPNQHSSTSCAKTAPVKKNCLGRKINKMKNVCPKNIIRPAFCARKKARVLTFDTGDGDGCTKKCHSKRNIPPVDHERNVSGN